MNDLVAGYAALIFLRDDVWDRLRAYRDGLDDRWSDADLATLLEQSAHDLAFEAAYLKSLATSLRLGGDTWR